MTTTSRAGACRCLHGFAPVDTAADDVALLAFTSGTTGRPKATMHFHRDVLANADTFSKHVLQADARRRLHRHAAAGVHVRPRRARGLPAAGRRATLLIEKATPDELAEHIAAHGVTVCFTAPTAYQAMLRGTGRTAVVDAASVRLGGRASAGGDLAAPSTRRPA